MELKEGQKLRVKEFDEIPSFWNPEMNKWMGKIVTFKNKENKGRIKIYEDINENWKCGWFWEESDFQIVFDKWEDVKIFMDTECGKYGLYCFDCNLKGLKGNIGSCYIDLFNNKNYEKLAENFEKMFEMECYVLEDEKMKKEFTIEDLKDGMLCETRNGEMFFWLNKKPRSIDGYLDYTNGNLKNSCCNEYDIVKVGYPNKEAKTINEMLHMDFGEIIWQEEPITKDISLEEINALLKEKYPDVEKFNLPIDKDK